MEKLNMNEINICERCDDEYESYIVLIRDDITEITSMVRCEYDNLCKPCRMHVTDHGVYLTESEKEELEPKKNIKISEWNK